MNVIGKEIRVAAMNEWMVNDYVFQVFGRSMTLDFMHSFT